MSRLSVVVEGDGDQGAVPILARRYFWSREQFDVQVGKAINAKGRSKLLREGELERFVRLAATQSRTSGVLVVCDADDDAPCELGPEITQRCQAASPQIPVRACLAVRAFENWLLASPETLAPSPQPALADYESVAAVGHIASWLAPRKYVKPLHQPALADAMDLEKGAARCRSFARLLRCLDELLPALTSNPA